MRLFAFLLILAPCLAALAVAGLPGRDSFAGAAACPPGGTETHYRTLEAWYGTLSGPGVDFDHLELTDMITGTVAGDIFADPGVDQRVKDGLAPWVNGLADIEWVLGTPEGRDAEGALRSALQAAAPGPGAVTFASVLDGGTRSYVLATWDTQCGEPPRVITNTGIASVHFFELNATYTEPPPGQTLAWGDVRCDGEVDSVDSLGDLRHLAHLLPLPHPSDCPEIGQTMDVSGASPHAWGDVDCEGDVNSLDALRILRFVAHLSLTPISGCPDVGAEVHVSQG